MFEKYGNYVFAKNYWHKGEKYQDGDKLPVDLWRNPTERKRLYESGFLRLADGPQGKQMAIRVNLSAEEVTTHGWASAVPSQDGDSEDAAQ